MVLDRGHVVGEGARQLRGARLGQPGVGPPPIRIAVLPFHQPVRDQTIHATGQATARQVRAVRQLVHPEALVGRQ